MLYICKWNLIKYTVIKHGLCLQEHKMVSRTLKSNQSFKKKCFEKDLSYYCSTFAFSDTYTSLVRDVCIYKDSRVHIYLTSWWTATKSYFWNDTTCGHMTWKLIDVNNYKCSKLIFAELKEIPLGDMLVCVCGER